MVSSDLIWIIGTFVVMTGLIFGTMVLVFQPDMHGSDAMLDGLADDMAADMEADEIMLDMLDNIRDGQLALSASHDEILIALHEISNENKLANMEMLLALERLGSDKNGTGIPPYAEGAGTLTKIFNADTLAIDGEKFQLSLTNAPEGKQRGAVRAMALVEAVCRVGSTVYYDIDDLQPEDRHGRHLAMVWCGGMQKPLNQMLLETGHAKVLRKYCGESEFGDLLCTGMPMPWNVMVTKGDCDQKPNTLPCQQNMTR